MAVNMCLLGSSIPVAATIVLTILLKNAIVTAFSECSSHDFPCEDGECIDARFWCDTRADCNDGSDEKYCKKRNWRYIDPNRCPANYFKCRSGPCIPVIGRCDGYRNCDDDSDERNCDESSGDESSGDERTMVLVTNLHTTLPIAIPTPKSAVEGYNEERFFTSLNVSEISPQMWLFSGLSLATFSVQRNKAKIWLLSQRKDDFGWGEETPRALIALYLSEQQPMVKYAESNILMIKQLEMQLSLEIARNGTKPMKLADLAIFINALLVSCKDPKNFYGDNLISILRDGVSAAQIKESFINPFIYITLCINNASTYDDARNLQDIILNQKTATNKIDMQALALLTTACIFKTSNFLNDSMYDSLKMQFLRELKVHGFPGNIYEAALLFQALKEIKLSLLDLTSFILKQQKPDGSFGDILSTYLVLPILAGKNILQMSNHCGERNISNLIPLEVLKNVKSKKMHIQYSLNYGFPPEVTQTIQIHVSEGTNFLNIMRLAQEINPKYQFKLSENRDVPAVYSVGGLPNDVEKGMYWTLYKASRNITENVSEIHWVHFVGDIRQMVLAEGDKVMFWYRPL